MAYDTNFTFLQLIIGYLVGRVIISYLLLPHYFRGELFTAYQLIERRFGGRLRSLTAGCSWQRAPRPRACACSRWRSSWESLWGRCSGLAENSSAT